MINGLLERLCKKVKIMTTMVEVYVHGGTVEKLLYLVLSGLNERPIAKKLPEFTKT